MVATDCEQTQVYALETPQDASAYRFPFEPYSIQLEFMQSLFETIESSKVGIFESPTGTGKSLSLICGALTWLQENQQRHLKGVTTVDTSNSEDPPWVQAFAVNRLKKEAEEEEAKRREEHEERVRRIQERDEKERKSLAKKRPRTYSRDVDKTTKKSAIREAEEDETEDEDQYILEDYDSDTENSKSGQPSGFANYSTEVLGLIKSLEEREKGLAGVANPAQQEEEPDEVKIIYCSRTHSQLSQFIHELKKTQFREEVKSVSLGSRKLTCIYEPVQLLNNVERMNDTCLDLQKPETKAEKKCPYLHKNDPVPMLDYKDRVLAAVQDIEELVSVGRRTGVCPYYGTRKAINPSQIVTMPYNVLLQKSSRDAMGISLKNNVLIIDEAHNLIDTITNVHSCTIGLSEVVNANQQLHLYLGKYRNRLKGKNQIYIRQILVLLGALIKNLNRHLQMRESLVTRVADDNEVTMKPVNEFLHQLKIDHLNIFKIQKYMKESQISKKLNGFTESNSRKTLLDETKEPKPTSGLHKVEAFLMSLTNANANGRVMTGVSTTNDRICKTQQPYLKYLLLNPSEQFKDIVDEVRSVILAGGTMEPISDFVDFLFPHLPDSKINKYAFGHIIPPESLLVLNIGESPTGYPLEFTYDRRSDHKMIDELGQVVANMCNIIPDGVVCFFPSYSFLDSVYQRWESTGVLSRIRKKKKIFQEPKVADMVDQTLREYAQSIEQPSDNLTGAILLSVVGGKMSEGINFSDRLGRGVIMVGLPFANLASPELSEKIKFIESNDNSDKSGNNGKGKAYYENLCMKAVNQSIGRAIRHKDDYAVILLVDRRFSTERIQQKLPAWIGKSIVNCPKFGMNVGKVAGFFRNRKQL
ncbi:DNA repair helicase [Basidiobolus meristosporus CBS 931.73]|uniref:ATP-dependent DNA helicase CHL1 n=1 Tax=Basidiobolus meristosporus CBS 931.73 TaxID=1314790 RepID=A0A1Y1YJZ8_9FUNG|nr:DNA repair helicase [Basidiobolus meristosporus CBS 931.73]|eukprot:ORX98335.1 DNA repair helicase [Basidiobolus meristosporus CBS 931.73]